MGETSWKFYISSEEAWEAMYSACERATRRIDFEQFIFYSDTIGSRFAELFIKKAKEGVKVRLLIDAGGSFAFFNSSLPKKMMDEGVEIEFFNKITPLRIHNLRLWFFRDHRKLMIVDGEVGFIGGVGISDFLEGWRDTHMSIQGDIVKEMENNFEKMWRITITERFLPFGEPRPTPNGFSLLTNAPHARQRFIYRRFISAIRNAKKYIYITTPYFVPDTRLFRVLRLAVRRGVKVHLLLPLSSDHPYVDWASHFHFNKAFRAGIRISTYTEMLHTKSIVIDGDWATVGSTNMDNYSFFFNYELNIISVDKKFIEEVKTQFDQDILKSTELTHEKWKERPFYQKVLEVLSIPFARFL